VSTPIFQLASMRSGHVVSGPALLVDSNSTIVVEPGFEAAVTAGGDIEITAVDAPVTAAGSLVEAGTAESNGSDSGAVDSYSDVPAVPVQLSIFGHRFMGIAEQMGRVLQRTSISVNIRERLVRRSVFGMWSLPICRCVCELSAGLFLCALRAHRRARCEWFVGSPACWSVAYISQPCSPPNAAPHIPVHLGAMQEAVRYQASIRAFLRRSVGSPAVLSPCSSVTGRQLPAVSMSWFF